MITAINYKMFVKQSQFDSKMYMLRVNGYVIGPKSFRIIEDYFKEPSPKLPELTLTRKNKSVKIEKKR